MRKWLPWMLALLFLAAVLWVVESSDVFQTCVQKKQAESASQQFDSDFPPHGKIRKGAPAINSAELDAFRHRQQGIPDSCWLYVWGRVRYLDGFNTKRFVDFCYRYYLAGTTWTISHRHGRQHEHGNRTDEG